MSSAGSKIPKKLNLKILKEIFLQAKGSDFLTDAYFKGILERRDQVLRSKCFN